MMPTHITRRTAIGASVSMIGLAFARRSSAVASPQHELDLFVFETPGAGNPVFAVVAATRTAFAPSGRSKFDVRIHAGQTSWTVRGVRPLQAGMASGLEGGRLFAGEVHRYRMAAGTRYTAVVLESPPDFVPKGERLPVWAEVHPEDGSRIRIGSPFVAELLAGDPALARAYHAASPAEDRVLFTEALGRRIATVAKARGRVANPDAHARRLAALLLPDVIEYRPGLPVGFNFAAQNGRHPADDAAAVAATVLTGDVARWASSVPFPVTGRFPYLLQPVIAA